MSSEDELTFNNTSSSNYTETSLSSNKISRNSTVRTTYTRQSLTTISTTSFYDVSSNNDERWSTYLNLTPSSSECNLPNLTKLKRDFFMREYSKITLLILGSTKSSPDMSQVVDSIQYTGYPTTIGIEDGKLSALSKPSKFVGDEINVTKLKEFKELLKLCVTEEISNQICFHEILLISIDYDKNGNLHNKPRNLNFEKFPNQKHVLSELSGRVGVLTLRIENVDKHFTTYCNSQLSINDNIAGTQITSVISNDFTHVEETKSEWYFEDNKKYEKKLELIKQYQYFTVQLKQKDPCKHKTRKGKFLLINPGNFLQDGGIYVLMRYLIITEYVGNLEFWTMDINGKIGMCKMDIGKKRAIFINEKLYKTIRIKKTFLRTCHEPDISKTYFLPNGHIVQHKWKGCPYYLHINLHCSSSINCTIDLYTFNDWMEHLINSARYPDEKDRIVANIQNYLDDNTQMPDLLKDYLLFKKLLKPETNVYKFTMRYFKNLFREKAELKKSKKSAN